MKLYSAIEEFWFGQIDVFSPEDDFSRIKRGEIIGDFETVSGMLVKGRTVSLALPAYVANDFLVLTGTIPDPPFGTAGMQGFQGLQGVGLGGTQGVQGTRGFQGFQGRQGVRGFQGFQGFQGTRGTQGFQGLQGAGGLQGFQGIQGPQGFQGFQGPQGTEGLQGFQGLQGLQGPQGFQGFQGTEGLQGFQGLQGLQGPAGDLTLDIPSDQTGTTYTLALTDAGKTVWMNNVAANTVTIPDNGTVPFPTNTVVAVIQEGAGTTSVGAATGVVFNSVTGGSGDLNAQFGAVWLCKRGTDTWVGSGALGAVS